MIVLFYYMRAMMKDDISKKAPQYADSTISKKAFNRLIFWFALYALLFCIGVVVAVGADMP